MFVASVLCCLALSLVLVVALLQYRSGTRTYRYNVSVSCRPYLIGSARAMEKYRVQVQCMQFEIESGEGLKKNYDERKERKEREKLNEMR